MTDTRVSRAEPRRSRTPRHARGRPPTASGGRARLVVRAGVTVAAVAAFVPGVVHSFDETAAVRRPFFVAGALDASRQAACVQATAHRTIPRGSRIFISNTNGNYSQLVAEAVTLWAVPTSRASDARWNVSMYYGPGGCWLHLRVVPER